MSKFEFIDDSDPHRDMPLIFLGGSSFIGLQTAQTLYYYYDLYNTYNSSGASLFYPEFMWNKIDFLNEKTLKKELKRFLVKSKAKFLINFAGISNPEEVLKYPEISQKINVDLNDTIIELCNELEVFPILISSDHVFSGDSGPYKENSIPNPLQKSLYGCQKLNAERLYQSKSNDFAIVRLSTILGINLHFQKQTVYPQVLSALINGKEIKGAINKYRSPSHVFNVAFLLNKLIERVIDNKIESNIFHIPGIFMSEYYLITEIARNNDFDESQIEKLVSSYEMTNKNNSYPLKLGLDSEFTKEILNARYLSFQEGLSVIKNEFKNNL